MEAGALDYLVKGEISPRSLERSLRYAPKARRHARGAAPARDPGRADGAPQPPEYDRILAEEEERSVRFGNPLALVIVDLDRFKSVNDLHGHPAGTRSSRRPPAGSPASIRTVDRAARIGGEEFALILVQTDRVGALEVARRAIARGGQARSAAGGGSVSVTASAGLPSSRRTAGRGRSSSQRPTGRSTPRRRGGETGRSPRECASDTVSGGEEGGRVLHVLTGCTAVGKTEWALRWAEAHPAEIISCDSLLFYRGMDIGTAKPSPAGARPRPPPPDRHPGVSEPMNAAVYARWPGRPQRRSWPRDARSSSSGAAAST